MEKKKLRVVEIPIEEVTPYINNPRHNDNAVMGVAASIKAFGFQQPIVVDKDMVVITGHTTLKAAKMLGIALIPVAIADDLTPEEARAYRLADNRTAEFAAWDTELLSESLEKLNKTDYEFPFDYGLGDVKLDEEMMKEFMGTTDTVVNTPDEQHEKKEVVCPRCGYKLSEVQ